MDGFIPMFFVKSNFACADLGRLSRLPFITLHELDVRGCEAMCTIVYINGDGVCWRLDWLKRHSKRVKRLAIGKLLTSDGDVVDAVVDDVAWVGGKVLHRIAILQKKHNFPN